MSEDESKSTMKQKKRNNINNTNINNSKNRSKGALGSYGGLWLQRKNIGMDVVLNCNHYFVIFLMTFGLSWCGYVCRRLNELFKMAQTAVIKMSKHCVVWVCVWLGHRQINGLKWIYNSIWTPEQYVGFYKCDPRRCYCASWTEDVKQHMCCCVKLLMVKLFLSSK